MSLPLRNGEGKNWDDPAN